MNQNQLATLADAGEVAESLIIKGDLSKLSPTERAQYYTHVCASLGLNPLTQPFAYINLSGRLTLYAKKDATDQLRRIYRVSITRIEQTNLDGVHIVTAYAAMPDGRTDSDSAAVNIANLKGDALANAVMKAITKAKRRVTLSICGLGILDETEVETIPDAKPFVEVASLPVPPEADVSLDELLNAIDALYRENYPKHNDKSSEQIFTMLFESAGQKERTPAAAAIVLQKLQNALQGKSEKTNGKAA